ncbi:protein ABHD15 [Diretmus argenteus]
MALNLYFPTVWDCLFCLLPAVLLYLLSLALRWPGLQCWLRLAGRAAGWRLWVTICWVLELPLHRDERTRAKETGPPGTDNTSGPGQTTSGKPSPVCKSTALAHYLLQHCSSLATPRLADWPRGDPHLQTLSSLLWGHLGGGRRGDEVQFTRDHLLMRDGGIVALDWAVGTTVCEVGGREGRKEPGGKALGCYTSTPPVLLLIPQSWGGVTPHLKELCHLALCQGFYVVVFHPRGTAGCVLTTPRLTEFGDPSDLVQAVAYIRSRHLSSALVAVSEGLGSGLLLSYLGECGSSSYLTAAAAISPVLQGQLWFETAMPPIYRWGALFHRKRQLSRYTSSFSAVLDVDRALSCSSLRDFEEALFCSTLKPQQKTTTRPTNFPSSGGAKPGVGSASHPLRGQGTSVWALGERAYQAKNWDSYWERNEPLRDADEVAVPVLCICSRDDPLLPPASTMPLPLFQSNPYFLLVQTDRGGHCGFTLEGRNEEKGGTEKGGIGTGKVGNWSHMAALDFFKVVANFLKGDERDGVRRDGAVGEYGQRNKTSTMVPPRRRRATMMRRSRPQGHEPVYMEGEDGQFTWKRSYTR